MFGAQQFGNLTLGLAARLIPVRFVETAPTLITVRRLDTVLSSSSNVTILTSQANQTILREET